MDNGTAWHNVEVHQLFVNENGWIVAAPFEYVKSYGLTKKAYTAEDIAGLYGVITHNAVDYAKLATNRETLLYVNADGTLSGAYTGTWAYSYSDGRQFITLTTTAGTFQCVLSQQLMDGLSSQTLAFSGVNAANERALWGYRHTNTATTNTTVYTNQAKMVGKPDYSLVWDSYSDFCKVSATGDFEVEYTFMNNTQSAENWHNWSIALTGNGQTWAMRADAFSNATFTGSSVAYKYNWDWSDFNNVYANKEVRVKIARIGTSINVFAEVAGAIVLTATATNCPTTDLAVYLGGETCFLDVSKVSVSKLQTRQLVGTVNEDGTYTAGFNVQQGALTAVSGDFVLNYSYYNYHNSESTNNWDNFLLKAVSGTQTMLLRADAYALNVTGQVAYSYDWDWANFISILSGADIDLTISRAGSTVTYAFDISAKDGADYHYKVVNTNAPTTDMSFGFTCEASFVGVLETEIIATVTGTNKLPVVSITDPLANTDFNALSSVPILIEATDADGTIASVTVYNGTSLLATLTAKPYSYTITNAAVGTYTLSAIATDNLGAKTISKTVQFQVVKQPTTYVYQCIACTDMSWEAIANWSPSAQPSVNDTAIIRTGEVKLAQDISSVVKVEPNGIFRITAANVSVPDLRLQGGVLKSYTSTPLFTLNSNITAEQASVIGAGSAATSVFEVKGTVGGNGDLNKTNIGILKLSADASNYTGNWTVAEGNLQIASSKSIGNNSVTVASGASLDIEAANVFIENVALNGRLILANDLTAQTFSVAGNALPAGAYTAADFPSIITGTGTLTVLQCSACAVTQTIDLLAGWNLIFINVHPADSTISLLFTGLDVLEVKNMDGFWRAGQDEIFNSLQTIESGRGYLVNMNKTGKLEVVGMPVIIHNSLFTINNGWKLIGCPYQSATPIADVLASKFSVVKDFAGFWLLNGTQNSIQDIEPGKGYFVK